MRQNIRSPKVLSKMCFGKFLAAALSQHNLTPRRTQTTSTIEGSEGQVSAGPGPVLTELVLLGHRVWMEQGLEVRLDLGAVERRPGSTRHPVPTVCPSPAWL